MPPQNANSGDTLLLIIALVAVVIFLLMLIAVFVVVRAERKPTSNVSLEEEPGSLAVAETTLLSEKGIPPEVVPANEMKAPSVAENFAGPLSLENPEKESAPDPDALVVGFPSATKRLSWVTPNWLISFIAATCMAWWNYSRLDFGAERISLYPYIIFLAIFSPASIAVAWLRLTGTNWRHSLSLFLWVAIASAVIWLIVWLLGFAIQYLSG